MTSNHAHPILNGLSDEEAQARLAREGYNELPTAKSRGWIGCLLDVIKEPMFMLLIACGVLYLLMGDAQEACILLSFVFVVIGITLYQEHKTERALDALRDLSSPRALVVRGGERRRIAGREVVRGDIIVLSEGDRVPADAKVLSCINLSADESLLTGESVPVRKAPAEPDSNEAVRPGGDDLPWVFSGSLIVQGQGLAEVSTTGGYTELGKIGKALREVEQEPSLLQREIGLLVRRLTIFGAIACSLVVVTYGLTKGDWLHGILAGLTLAMAMLPEEFPVVLTVFMALGAWRMSQKKVLTRRAQVIETLGAATVLCVDKTGTLTYNRMTLGRLYANGELFEVGTGNTSAPVRLKQHEGECQGVLQGLPETFHDILEFGILASQQDPFDPMEQALVKLGNQFLERTGHIHGNWSLVHEYALSRELLAMTRVWESPDKNGYFVAAKGAPESIVDLCHLSESETLPVMEAAAKMAQEGLRVLGVARGQCDGEELPRGQHDFSFKFVGLMGFTDPVRDSAIQAVALCQHAGIRVAMITGDYPATACQIAQSVGISPCDEVVTGPELETLSDAELSDRIKRVNIFARVVPEQKLRLVNAFKANGEIVAMTGDGVNDAPALKSAYIGIAMGGRGTDVARESADLVLLDDDFSRIADAVRMGRRIFDNLRKAAAFIISVHVPIAGMSLIPVFFDWPLLLLPVHVMFLELLIDPACSVVFEMEREEDDIMDRKPRLLTEGMLSRSVLIFSLMQGLGVLAVILAVVTSARYRGMDDTEVRVLAFTTLTISNLMLILANRSWAHTFVHALRNVNSAFWYVTIGATVSLALVVNVPMLRDSIFHFAPLHAIDIALCVGLGLLSLAWFEGLKALRRWRTIKL